MSVSVSPAAGCEPSPFPEVFSIFGPGKAGNHEPLLSEQSLSWFLDI